MKNAFAVLGATPFDDAERLEELFEEKELISDDDTEAQAAYTELSNPKRRVISELAYFAGETFSAFESIALGTRPVKPTVGEAAQAIVNMGKWLDSANEAVLDEINDARSSSNFPLIDESLLRQSVDTFSSECSALAQKYFDRLKENSLVSIFNNIVKIKDYGSFFIDGMVEKYALLIDNALQEKENQCQDAFNAIERICNGFIYGSGLLISLDAPIDRFAAALTSWDRYAQPLQVNAQYHGAQHEESADLVRALRNKIIDICNRSQESIQKLLDNMRAPAGSESARNTREQLPLKISNSIIFTDSLIRLINILLSVFAELEISAEQLKEDRQSLKELRTILATLDKRIKDAQQEAEREMQRMLGQMSHSSNSSDCCSCGCYIATCVYGSYNCPEVWTLRRYRDQVLGATWYGRAFIRLYYAISPTIVRLFGNTRWFKRFWKSLLDKQIAKLQSKGFENTPYKDVDWRK